MKNDVINNININLFKTRDIYLTLNNKIIIYES